MTPDPDNWHERTVSWTRSGNPILPYNAVVDGHWWQIEIGDFPDEPMYALLIDGDRVARFDDWPAAWERPASGDQGSASGESTAPRA